MFCDKERLWSSGYDMSLEHLGGSYQPIGQDFAGANLTVPAGSNQVPGLEEALKAFLNKG